ncbi:MAG: ABC transporter ATP-binding protein [Sneathiellaceae bacterium]
MNGMPAGRIGGGEVEVRELARRWGDTAALDGISFTAEAGRFTVLLGPSGCGKSTTLRLVAGIDTASAGSIRIGGRDVTAAPPAARGIAMVFQSYALFPHLDVAENILFGLKVRGTPRAERQARLARTATLLGLEGLLGRKPSQLSGGQQQRVALGRAIIAEQPVCLMDEPLSNLDAKLRHEMRIEIRALQRKLGITMLYVTHDQAEAIAMADRIVLLHDGRIAQDAAPQQIYGAPASLTVARFIGTPPMNLLHLAPGPGGHAIRGMTQPVLRLPVAGPLILGLRPEEVAPVAVGGLPATVEGLEYLGADSLVDCRLGSERLTLRLPGAAPLPPGGTVRLGWPPAAMHLFDETTGERLHALSDAAAGMAAAWEECAG